MDPGKHVIEVSAPGYLTSRWEGEATPSVTTEIDVVLSPAVSAAATSKDVGRSKRGTNARTYLLLGAAGLAVGSITFFALSVSARGDALDKCIPERGFCSDADGVASVDRARTFAWVSIGMLGVAAAATGVGIVVGNGPSGRTSSLAARPVAGGAALSFERRF